MLLPASAQVRWDGDRDQRWDEAANWEGDARPSGDTVVLFEEGTGPFSFSPQIVSVQDGLSGAVIIDRPVWALRPESHPGKLTIAGGGILFTDRFKADGAFKTFAGNTDGQSLQLLLQGQTSIVNNGSGTVFFSAAGPDGGFSISAVDGVPPDLLLGGTGSGGFVWEDGFVSADIASFGTADGFAAVLEIRGGRLDMRAGLRAEGGRIRIAADDVIGDEVNLVLGSARSADAAVIDISGARDTVGGLEAFKAGGILQVDASTHYTFRSYNGGPVRVEGFVEGETVLRFSRVIDPEALKNLFINGEPVAGLARKPERGAATPEAYLIR